MKDIIALLSKTASLLATAVLFFCKFLGTILKKLWKFIILLLTTIFSFLIIKKTKEED